TIVSVVTLVWGISPRQPSGKNIIRWLLKKRTNGSVRYCQYTSFVRMLFCRRCMFSPYSGLCDASVNSCQKASAKKFTSEKKSF
ncbi:hypothetical protein, partial [Escherichia coli]|uniref:hypothetical protein n=1 Tax=Escherichia coli TaxID=562 RepID=UPI0021C5A1C8